MSCPPSTGHLTRRTVIRVSALLFLVALPGSVVQAQRTVLAPTVLERFRLEPIGAPGASSGLRTSPTGVTIFGIVQNRHGLLVPNAGVIVVRDLRDGEVVAEAPVDELAQFVLGGFAPGLYTAEVVDATGSVLATTGAFTAAVGQRIEVAPIIPVSPLGLLSQGMGSYTSRAVRAAADSGVLAFDSGEPISP